MRLTTVPPDHPKQKLLFFVAQDVDASIRDCIRRLVDKLAVSRSWVIGPPRIVDVKDSGNSPSETVGGELQIYSALTPGGLARDVDGQHFDEVTSIVDAVKVLSAQSGLAFEFELDGTFVGAIEDGELDRSLRVGLLQEWKKHLSTMP